MYSNQEINLIYLDDATFMGFYGREALIRQQTVVIFSQYFVLAWKAEEW
jgi:hypothetical protein